MGLRNRKNGDEVEDEERVLIKGGIVGGFKGEVQA